MRPVGAVPERLGHRVAFRPDAVGAEPPAAASELERDPSRDSREIRRFDFSKPGGRPSVPSTAPGLGRIPFSRERLPGGTPDRAIGMVRVAEIQPEGPVRPQHSANFVEDRGEVIDKEIGVRFEAQLTEPALAARARPGRPMLDVRPRMAGVSRRTVRHTERRASPPGWESLPIVTARGVSAPEHGRDSIVPQPPVGRRGDDTVNRLVGRRPEDLPDLAFEDGRLQSRWDHGPPPTSSIRGGLVVSFPRDHRDPSLRPEEAAGTGSIRKVLRARRDSNPGSRLRRPL